MVAHSAVQSSTQTVFTITIFHRDPKQYLIQQSSFLIGKTYLVIIGSNGYFGQRKNITLIVNLVTYRIDTAENSEMPDTVQIRKSHCKQEATGYSIQGPDNQRNPE